MAAPGEAVVVRLPERFEAFYEREYHRVVGFAYAVAGSWEAAEDATQEAFLRAHRQWERVGRYDQPGAWVRRVAANLAVSAFRRRLAEGRALVRLAARRQPDPPLRPEVLDFWRAVRSLPSRQRQAVALFYLEDWPVAEIARFLGCTETTVRGHLHRGRAALGPAPGRSLEGGGAVSVDTRGRRAAQDLIRAAEQRGPVPALERLRRRHRHRRLGRAGLAVAAVIVVGALVVQALPTLERGSPGPVPPAGAPATTRTWPGVPGLDRHVRDAVATGKAQLAEVAVGPSGVWVLNRRHGKPDALVRVDPATDAVLARLPVGGVVSHLAVGEDGGVWLYRTAMTLVRPELVRVDPSTNRVADTIALPPGPPGIPTGASALLVAGGSVWLADQHNRLFQVDPASRRVREVTDGGHSLAIDHLAYAGGWVWGNWSLLLYRIDPRTGTVTMTVNNPELHNAMPASGLATGAGQLWLYGLGGTGQQLLKLDPANGRLLAMRQFSSRTDQTGVMAAGDRVVAARNGRRLLLSDPGGTLRATVPVPEAQGGLAVGPDVVWVADPTRGRLLRVDPGF